MRIILADAHEQARRALQLLLEEQPEFDFMGQAADAQGLLKLARTRRAELVLIDGGLPGMPIADLIANLHALEPRPLLILMSSEVESCRALLNAGADAFASKGDPPDWLLEKLQGYAAQLNEQGGSK